MEKKQYSMTLPGAIGPAVSFGVAELAQAMQAAGWSDGPGFSITLEQKGNGVPESFSITRPDPLHIVLSGADERGLMVACLDLAEQIAMHKGLEGVTEKQAAPELRTRGLHTFLHNPETEKQWLYDPQFWQAYADSLARDRYNRFNLIYGHQSPHLVPIYTFLLDDLDEEFPEIQVQDLQPEERANNLKALQMASAAMASRGIDFFLGIWNSRPWTTYNGVWETQPTRVTGTDDLGMLTTYTRKGFTRLMELCPDIHGIQLRMNIESGIADQRFFVQAFVPALKELRARGREIKVELRNWGLHPDTIEAFRQSGADIVVSTKYFAEHQGMPYQPPVTRGSYSYDSFLRKDKPFPFQWHVWNLGTHRLFTWGDPDYARRFALSCHLGDGVGFEVTPPGSQKGYSQWGYVFPGDWNDRKDLPFRWDFQRYWFFHMAFGRMAYDVHTPDSVFLYQIAQRTSAEAAPMVFEAYRAASQVISYLISQRMDDPNMYVWPEIDAGGPIDHNMIAPPGEETLFATAREYAKSVVAQKMTAKRSPFDCARDLDGFAEAIETPLDQLKTLPGLEDSLEYHTIRADFAALAALARYQAAKSRATGNLALFYASGDRTFLDLAEAEAREGVRFWDVLCEITEVYYDQLHYGPSGGHWKDNIPRVAYDLRRIQRVRDLFEKFGLFQHGFDFGPSWPYRHPSRAATGLEPEPRFQDADYEARYTPEKGSGWTQTAGLRAFSFGQLPHNIVWGVHFITPGKSYDPAVVGTMPLDGLTQRYVMSDQPHTFQIDVPDGEYEVTVITPAVMQSKTIVTVADVPMELGNPGQTFEKTFLEVRGGTITIEGAPVHTSWALAGLVIRPRAPLIAHLAPLVLHAGEDWTVSATATAPDGIRAMRLGYRVNGEWHEADMQGDGTVFQCIVSAVNLQGDAIPYFLTAEDGRGTVTRKEMPPVKIVEGFEAPCITCAGGPATWRPEEALTFTVNLENGAFARELVLHYREADQNRNFRQTTQPAGRSGAYQFTIDPQHLDGNYELIYYFEVRDVTGAGSFYPDPFSEARYSTIKPV
jgi:hypothetical protein